MRIAVASFLLLALASPLGAQNKKAARLAEQAAALAASVEDIWADLLTDAGEVAIEEIDRLIAACVKAADLYAQSLELEYRPAVNDRIVKLDKRSRMARRLRTQKVREQGGEPAEAGAERSREAPTPRKTLEELFAQVPVPEETRRQQLRRQGQLRRFLLAYGANRKLGTLVTRCGPCNGQGRRSSGKLDKKGRVLKVACDQCYGTGAHLNLYAARRVFWLSKSPYYRADERNLKRFEGKLEKWRRNPKSIREFVKRISVKSTEYHGLWAEVTYEETVRKVGVRGKTITREVEAILIRIGDAWYFFDEKYDREFLETPSAA